MQHLERTCPVLHLFEACRRFLGGWRGQNCRGEDSESARQRRRSYGRGPDRDTETSSLDAREKTLLGEAALLITRPRWHFSGDTGDILNGCQSRRL